MRVVICGGGVIGACAAYFLARRGLEVLVVEGTAVACAASGKSGGFLALDWCDGTPLEPLARRSFALHAQLAAELGGAAWGYRRLTTYGGHAGQSLRASSRTRAWLSQRVALHQQLGTPETTAQVHPRHFTSAMLRAAQALGAQLRIGEVTGVARHPRGDRVQGVAIGADVVQADAVVVAMGPWSLLAAAWLPVPAVHGLKGHSLVFDTGDCVPAEALFLEYEDQDGGRLSPEIFPRADGTTYVCAVSSEPPLPLDPAQVVPDPGAIERLHALCRDVSPVLRDAKVMTAQACFRPVSRDGLPLIGAAPSVAGAYIATGHGVWGILNAPATGEALAELIATGTCRGLDLAAFDPGRLRPLDPARLRAG
jgi:glycine/D-amino acid oxidase-like deaminating enzyme